MSQRPSPYHFDSQYEYELALRNWKYSQAQLGPVGTDGPVGIPGISVDEAYKSVLDDYIKKGNFAFPYQTTYPFSQPEPKPNKPNRLLLLCN